jgi:hypothetical protein
VCGLCGGCGGEGEVVLDACSLKGVVRALVGVVNLMLSLLQRRHGARSGLQCGVMRELMFV